MAWIKNFTFTIKERLIPYKTACISIAISIFAIVMVSTISATGDFLINNELDSIGLDSMTIGVTNNSEDGETVLNSEIYSVMGGIDGIDSSTPVIMDSGSYKLGLKGNGETLFWGISEKAYEIIALDILYGEMFTSQDILESNKVCLIDEAIAQQSYQRTNVVGKEIALTVNGIAHNFKIIGVLQKESSLLNNVAGNIMPNFIYMPYSTLSNFSAKSGYDQIVFKTEESSNPELIKSKILSEIGKNEYKITDLFGQRESIDNIVSVASAVMMIIAGVALTVSGVAVVSSVGTAVRMKRKEIGVKKSLGASNEVILKEFITDIFIGSLLSITLSVIFGTILLYSIIKLLGFPFYLSPSLIIGGSVVMLIISLVFGYFPAKAAASMKPVDALRDN